MKILLIQPCFVDFGGYFRSMGMARALAKRGDLVDLLISSKENSLTIKKAREIKNLTVYQLPRINFHQFVNGKIFRGLLACFFILFKNYDLIHVFESNQFESILPLVLCKMTGKKVVLDIDEEWLDSFLCKMNKLMAIYIRFCDTFLATKFDYLTVTSEHLVKKFRRLEVKHVFKIINGVDLDQFVPMNKNKARKYLSISPQEKIILAMGNTYEGERAFLLFKTFEEILKKDKTVKLYFNLDPQIFWQKEKIKKNINKDIFSHIVHTGFINLKTKKGLAYLGAADLTLFLMGNTPSEKACFPVRIGTYLNGGKVIALNKTNTEAFQTLAKYHCLVSGEGPSEMAQEIVKFFKNEQKRRQLKKKVLRAKKELSWDNLIDGLLEFYSLVS